MFITMQMCLIHLCFTKYMHLFADDLFPKIVTIKLQTWEIKVFSFEFPCPRAINGCYSSVYVGERKFPPSGILFILRFMGKAGINRCQNNSKFSFFSSVERRRR